MGLFEPAILQKSHLLRFGLEVGRFGYAELSSSDITSQFIPVGSRLFDSDLDSHIRYTALAQVQANSNRAFAAIDVGLDKRCGEALIALQAVCGKFEHGLFGHVSVVAFACKLLDEFCLAVFTASKESHGFMTRISGTRKTICPLAGEKIANFFVEFRHLNLSVGGRPAAENGRRYASHPQGH